MTTSRLGFLLGTLVLLAGCGPEELENPNHPTGSHAMVASADASALYAAVAEAGEVVRVDTTSADVSSLNLGGEPTRIAPVGDRLLVSLRTERQLAVLQDVDGELELVDRIPTGAEPYGLVASEDGSRVYVALSQSNRVEELDGQSFELLRSWDVEGDPRWLALEPSGRTLYVSAAYSRELVAIDLDSSEVVQLELPTVETISFDESRVVPMTPRLTGDLAISPDGTQLVVPVLYVDNVRAPIENIPTDYDGNSVEGSKFNPGAVIFPLVRSGDIDAGAAVVLSLAGFDGNTPFRGYAASASFSADSATMAFTLEGSDAIVTAASLPVGSQATSLAGGGGSLPLDAHGMVIRPLQRVETGSGPRGLVFEGVDRAWILEGFSQALSTVSFDGSYSSEDSGAGPVAIDRTAAVGPELAALALPADVAEGRRLFYSQTDSAIVSSGAAGVSCATCHFEGRNDGLTWPLEIGGRQTPSLAGMVSLTAPVTWDSSVPSVGDEAAHTSEVRMGGVGLSPTQSNQVAAYVDWTRDVDVARKGESSESVARGAELFAREDVGCAECHEGAMLTDNAIHPMYGLDEVRTRSLVGIAATAPYFHDGSSPTLRAVLERSRDGSMGDTSMLSSSELDDMEAYLLSL